MVSIIIDLLCQALYRTSNCRFVKSNIEQSNDKFFYWLNICVLRLPWVSKLSTTVVHSLCLSKPCPINLLNLKILKVRQQKKDFSVLTQTIYCTGWPNKNGNVCFIVNFENNLSNKILGILCTSAVLYPELSHLSFSLKFQRTVEPPSEETGLQ